MKATFFKIGILLLVNINSINAQFLVSGPTTNQTSPGPLDVNSMYIGIRNYFNNSAVGNSALLANTTGYHNTAFGYFALSSNTTANNNVAIGSLALQYALGSSNTCVGFGAGQGGVSAGINHTGVKNSAFGEGVLYSLLSANGNTSVGYNSMHSNAVSDSNTSVGVNAMALLTTGGANTSIGYNSLLNLVNGRNNVGVGSAALLTLTAGNNNLGLGYGANVSNGIDNQLSIQNVIYGTNMNSTNSGNIGIGISTPTQQFHTTRGVRFQGLTTSPGGASAITNMIGADATGVLWLAPIPARCGLLNYIPKTANTSGDMGCSLIYDDATSVGISTTGPFTYTSFSGLSGTTPPPSSGTYKLAVNGVVSALAYYASSDSRFKNDITNLTDAMSKIRKIRPVTYFWKDKEFPDKNFDNTQQIGFIAQELEKIVPQAVAKNKDGYYAVNYSAIIPVLTAAVKEQDDKIQQQEIQIADLTEKINVLTDRLNRLLPENVKVADDYFTVSPNPVTSSSIVRYNLPETVRNCTFVIYDLNGRILKKYPVSGAAKSGRINITKSEFAGGMYMLSLLSDNSEIQTKRFLISE
ncbi:MAG: tail fiber domain-containing protein [Ferruginibacter sp.]